jgi:agmatinase
MCVGGDHSILLPILRAMHAAHGPVGLIQLDAHSDTWDQYWGMKYSHGTPVRRAIEEGLLAEPYILQIGLRGQLYDANDMDFAREHKIMLVTAEEFHEHGLPLIREKLKAFTGAPGGRSFERADSEPGTGLAGPGVCRFRPGRSIAAVR